MKKLKVVIKGIAYGQTERVKHEVEVPVFEVKKGRTLGNIVLPDLSIEEQEINYIDDNYTDLIFKPAEVAGLWPVYGYTLVRTTSKRKKIESVIELANEVLKEHSESVRLDFAATLAKLYKDIRTLSIENIVKVVLLAQNTGYDVAAEALRKVTESMDDKFPNLID